MMRARFPRTVAGVTEQVQPQGSLTGGHPAGYVDGMSMYLYVKGNPWAAISSRWSRVNRWWW